MLGARRDSTPCKGYGVYSDRNIIRPWHIDIELKKVASGRGVLKSEVRKMSDSQFPIMSRYFKVGDMSEGELAEHVTCVFASMIQRLVPPQAARRELFQDVAKVALNIDQDVGMSGNDLQVRFELYFEKVERFISISTINRWWKLIRNQFTQEIIEELTRGNGPGARR